MRLRWLASILFSASVAAGIAQATTTVPVERKCPVGGEKYQSFEIASTSYYGIRLDLQRTGVGAYLPYIECPNGFVVFKQEAEFTADEIAKLTPVVASERYQNARKNGPVALRVVMLHEALGKSDSEIRGYLFRVAFESENRFEALRLQFLARAAEAYRAAMAAAPKHDDAWLSDGIRRADLLRQLSRFDECAAAIPALQQAAADKPPHIFKIIAQILSRAKAGDAAPAEFAEEGE